MKRHNHNTPYLVHIKVWRDFVELVENTKKSFKTSREAQDFVREYLNSHDPTFIYEGGVHMSDVVFYENAFGVTIAQEIQIDIKKI